MRGGTRWDLVGARVQGIVAVYPGEAREMVSFGTSGLRGLADDLTDDLVRRYVHAFAMSFPHQGALVMGRDLRASSPRLAGAVAEGAAMAGVRVVDCGVLPTPALALEADGRRALAVMVTGSHIPADRNGLKFYTQDGEITKADEAVLVAAVARGDALPDTPVPELEICAASEAYVARYIAFFGEAALRGKRIGLWEHSSAACEVLPHVLRGLGAEVVHLDRSDDFVAVDTEAIDARVRLQLAGWASEHGLDGIVSTDGDADRPLVADGAGRVVPGDVLGPLVAQYLGARCVVTTVSANTMVEAMDVFDDVERCRIGSPYVIEKMEEKMIGVGTNVVGYEPNGGFLLGFEVTRGGRRLAPLMTRDAVLPIIGALVAAGAGPLADLIATLPMRRTATDRLTDVPREISKVLVERFVQGDAGLVPERLGLAAHVDLTDGARVTFGGGEIVTVRPSGNAPELRCYVEADSAQVAEQLLAEMLARLRAEVRAHRT